MTTDELIVKLRTIDSAGTMQVLVAKDNGSGLTHDIFVDHSDVASLALLYDAVDVNPWTTPEDPVVYVVEATRLSSEAVLGPESR